MKCTICGKGPMHGVTVYRMNEKGVAGIWACWDHKGKLIDPDLLEITRDIEAAVRTPMKPRRSRR